VFPGPFELASLGRVVVLGGGRALGSAILSALLAGRAAGNGSAPLLPAAVDDGRRGFLSAVPFSVPLHEVDVQAEGVLRDLWGARDLAPDTLFVDLDPAAPVAPWGAPLACALLLPRFHGGALNRTRVLFLQPAAGGVALDESGLHCDDASGAPAAAAVGLLQWWAGAAAAQHVLLGEGMDPSSPHAPVTPLTILLRCLIEFGDRLPYEAHDFVTERALDAFFAAAQGNSTGACGALLAAGAAAAGAGGASSAHGVAADALWAALALPTGSGDGASTTLAVFSAPRGGGGGAGAPLLPPAPPPPLRNNVPHLADLVASDPTLAPTLAALLSALRDGLSGGGEAAAEDAPGALAEALWQAFRQALLHGFRDPEPHPVYDAATLVSPARYTVHDLNAFGISHEVGHAKMRQCAAAWGWRFKRGGIPWSSTKGDDLVPLHVISSPLGNTYDKLALRTVMVWQWALAVYGHHAWHIRMWDDVFPVVERYLDVASANNHRARVAVGRAISQTGLHGHGYLSGGPPGLFSAGWAAQWAAAAPTCLALFENFAGAPMSEGRAKELAPPPGRGRQVHNERWRRQEVATHCGLGCEDLVIEWCMRDVVGAYYELAYWWGFESLAPSTMNDKALFECKALQCRRRYSPTGDPSDLMPIPSVVFHYVKPPDARRIEQELYGLPPGSAQWLDECEAAQQREGCKDQLIPMPLPGR
jgi:hypothetical protein